MKGPSSILSDLLFRIRALFRLETVERELDEELRLHIEHAVEKQVRMRPATRRGDPSGASLAGRGRAGQGVVPRGARRCVARRRRHCVTCDIRFERCGGDPGLCRSLHPLVGPRDWREHGRLHAHRCGNPAPAAGARACGARRRRRSLTANGSVGRRTHGGRAFVSVVPTPSRTESRLQRTARVRHAPGASRWQPKGAAPKKSAGGWCRATTSTCSGSLRPWAGSSRPTGRTTRARARLPSSATISGRDASTAILESLGRPIRLNSSPFTIVGVGPRAFVGEVVGSPADVGILIPLQPWLQGGMSRLDNRGFELAARAGPPLHLGLRSEGPAQNARSSHSRRSWNSLDPNLSSNQVDEIRARPIPVQSGARGFSWVRKNVAPLLFTLMAVVGRCWSLPARTLRTSSSPGPWPDAKRSRCGWPSVQAAGG